MLMQLGSQAPEFSLPDAHGGIVSRSDAVGKPLLVMFWCNHCPYVVHLRDSVVSLLATLVPRGLAAVAINSNDADAYPADNAAAMRQEAQTHNYPFAYLIDAQQVVATNYRAACTPDFFLFDASHKLVYRGGYDDSSPGNGRAVTGAWLQAAVQAVFDKKPPLQEQHPSLGCSIKWRPEHSPAWFVRP